MGCVRGVAAFEDEVCRARKSCRWYGLSGSLAGSSVAALHGVKMVILLPIGIVVDK